MLTVTSGHYDYDMEIPTSYGIIGKMFPIGYYEYMIVPDKIYNILSGHEFYVGRPIKKVISSSEYTSLFKDIEHYIWKRDNTIIKCHEKLFLILKLSCG